jgi:hypothetical protein
MLARMRESVLLIAVVLLLKHHQQQGGKVTCFTSPLSCLRHTAFSDGRSQTLKTTKEISEAPLRSSKIPNEDESGRIRSSSRSKTYLFSNFGGSVNVRDLL